MRVLVACEEGQAVTCELRALGHEAFSCDILPTGGPYPEYHFEGDVKPYLLDPWDMILAFPPCTHLAVSGAKHFAEKQADGRQQDAIDFFNLFADLDCERVAIENPVGVMSKHWRKPDQIINPWQFGDEYQKTTCLWLKGLPKLQHFEHDDLFNDKTWVGKGDFVTTPKGAKLPKWYSDNTSAKNRSKTFPGIARAMAEQWGGVI